MSSFVYCLLMCNQIHWVRASYSHKNEAFIAGIFHAMLLALPRNDQIAFRDFDFFIEAWIEGPGTLNANPQII